MLKSRKAKHGWVGTGAQRSHGKPNGKFVASVVAPGSGAEPRIVLGGGFPTREVSKDWAYSLYPDLAYVGGAWPGRKAAHQPQILQHARGRKHYSQTI